jgi:hypothetical protein
MPRRAKNGRHDPMDSSSVSSVISPELVRATVDALAA